METFRLEYSSGMKANTTELVQSEEVHQKMQPPTDEEDRLELIRASSIAC